MPMTSCFVGGGVTDSGTEDLTGKCDKFKQVMQEVAAFVVQEYVPIALALGALYTAVRQREQRRYRLRCWSRPLPGLGRVS